MTPKSPSSGSSRALGLVPLLALVESSTDSTITVAEISSFQLETIAEFRPEIGVLLNLTPDQSERLKTILDDFAKYHEDLEAQIEDVRATGRNRIVQILTPEQRKRFVDAFYHSLLHNYGAALVDFTADRFNILPYKGDPADSMATVRTEVKRSNGERVPVNFSLRKVDGMWKAWDVVIEGISYVKSFKTDFGAEIQQQGLDEVINRLETNAKPAPGAPASSH